MPLSAVNSATSTLKPTRRLKAAASKVFEGVSSSFVHLTAADAEQLTQYAEWSAIYSDALRETQRSPTISVPVVNRTSGNVVGERITRSPSFATLREAQQQVTSLARRLLIDAHSADKRARLLTRKARALQALEAEQAAITAQTFTEEEIEAEMNDLIRRGYTPRGEALRNAALDYLRIKREIAGIEDDPDCDVLFASPRRSV